MKKNPSCWLLALFLAFSQGGEAQLIDREFLDRASVEDAGALPKARVVDYGDIFARDGGGFEEITARFDRIYERYGYSVYFVAYSGIIGADLQTRSEDLRDQWLGQGEEGLVYVCDTDMKQVAFSLTRSSAVEEQRRWKLQDHQVLDVMSRVMKESVEVEHASESDYLRFLATSLADELEGRLVANEQPVKGASPYYLLAFAIAGCAILGLIAWARRTNRHELLSREKIAFPELEIPSRLGAQYGGGLVSEINFRPVKK